MATLVLVRHGESTWNAEGRWQGHADPPLSDAGRAQAEALAEELAGEQFDAVYASDLARAAQTAEILARRLGLPIVADPALREVDIGSWSGLTRDEVTARYPGAKRHDGEADEVFVDRIVGAVRGIAAAHPVGTVLIVTHGGPISVVEVHATGTAQKRRANCEVFRFTSEELD